MVTPIFSAVVDDQGKLSLYHPEVFKREVKRLAGKRVDVTVKVHREKRSDRQNRWWWGVAVEMLAEECGYDRESMHYALVAKCFGTTYDDRIGLEVPNARSSRLTTKQFSELMEWVVVFAATELGVTLPLPDEAEVV